MKTYHKLLLLTSFLFINTDHILASSPNLSDDETAILSADKSPYTRLKEREVELFARAQQLIDEGDAESGIISTNTQSVEKLSKEQEAELFARALLLIDEIDAPKRNNHIHAQTIREMSQGIAVASDKEDAYFAAVESAIEYLPEDFTIGTSTRHFLTCLSHLPERKMMDFANLLPIIAYPPEAMRCRAPVSYMNELLDLIPNGYLQEQAATKLFELCNLIGYYPTCSLTPEFARLVGMTKQLICNVFLLTAEFTKSNGIFCLPKKNLSWALFTKAMQRIYNLTDGGTESMSQWREKGLPQLHRISLAIRYKPELFFQDFENCKYKKLALAWMPETGFLGSIPKSYGSGLMHAYLHGFIEELFTLFACDSLNEKLNQGDTLKSHALFKAIARFPEDQRMEGAKTLAKLYNICSESNPKPILKLLKQLPLKNRLNALKEASNHVNQYKLCEKSLQLFKARFLENLFSLASSETLSADVFEQNLQDESDIIDLIMRKVAASGDTFKDITLNYWLRTLQVAPNRVLSTNIIKHMIQLGLNENHELIQQAFHVERTYAMDWLKPQEPIVNIADTFKAVKIAEKIVRHYRLYGINNLNTDKLYLRAKALLKCYKNDTLVRSSWTIP